MDLSTRYLGLVLKNPIVPSASPLSKSLDVVKMLEDAGAPAIVMYSLFEEQINRELEELDDFMSQGTEGYAESLSYFPEPEAYNLDPESYLEHVRKLKTSLSIPVIASLNGVSSGGWIQYARYLESAGADAIELNIYYVPTDSALPGALVEENAIKTVAEVRKTVAIPIAVKLSPYFSNVAYMAKRLVEAGANGLVMFNRFYQPDLDLETLDVVPRVHLSTSADLTLPLRWVGILHKKVDASLAATTGVHTHLDALKVLMAGADVAMMCAALLERGPGYLGSVLKSLEGWMNEREYASIDELKGCMSHKNVTDPSSFERAHYMRAINSFTPPYSARPRR
ncbi:MAG: dihydroorotate dehydrogenase-like protein [Deltaproteobacteria bacterium]|nr:dihydroorotate dehydrogenase-like protein [Deltaproteobacteria bacterium]